MFKEFNVKFEDVEILGDGTDSLLEGTEVTKVVLRGENNFSSLDSTLKNCNELDTIDGNLNLKDVTDIDNLLEGTELVTTVNLVNINNENMSVNNPFPNVNEIGLGGDIYNKKALQNVIATKDWTFEGFKYKDNVGKNITTQEMNIVDDNKVTIKDTLEQKARGFEIIGQTYENLVVGSGEVTLLDELTLESVDGSPNEFNPHIEQLVCVETIEGETYQNLVNGKGEYKLTDTFSSTWTESNNSIDNPPSMIEIPEIWGNTVQGYCDLLSAKDFVEHFNNIKWTSSDIYAEHYSNNTFKVIRNINYYANEIRDSIASDNSKAIKLKPSTKYTIWVDNGNCSLIVSTPNSVILNSVETKLGSYTFTTDSTGLIGIGLKNTNSTLESKIRLVEGEIADLHNTSHNFNLNYIQSVGDLYVDESGEPILDDEGNEQYKLEIESNDNINILDYELGHDIGLYNDDGTFDTSQTRNHTGKCYCRVKEGKRYIIYNNSGSGFGQWVKIYTFDENKNFIKKVFDSYEANAFYYTIPKGLNIKYIKLSIVDVWDKPHIIEDGKEIKFYGSGKGLSNKTTILMPQPLMKLKKVNNNYSDLSDKLYWDSSANKYYIENNIYKLVIKRVNDSSYNGTFFGDIQLDNVEGFDVSTVYRNTVMPLIQKMTFSGWGVRPTNSDFGVGVYSSGVIRIYGKEGISITPDEMNKFIGDGLDFFVERRTPQIIETKILEKPSLETYSPKTYISTNIEIQPSKMTITNKKVDFIPLGLQANKDYTLQLDSIGKEDKPITVNLGGTETTIQPINDTSKHHKVVVRTPSTLTNDTLELSGEGVIVNDVMLFQGGSDVIKQDVGYIDGIESIGELQGDGTYKIDILSVNDISNLYTGDVTMELGAWNDNGSSVATSVEIRCKNPFTPIPQGIKNGDVLFLILSDTTINSNTNLHQYDSNKKYTAGQGAQVSNFTNGVATITIKDISKIQYFSFRAISSNAKCKWGLYLENNGFIEKIESTQSILLPQPLNKIGDIKDKFYWDEDKGHYCIEQNVSKELEVMASPNIIDLPHLNKKYSLDTYIPTTYLQCVDTTIQPSKLLLKSDIVRYKPSALETNTDYTVQFECKEKSDKKVKLNLGGSEKEVDAIVGLNHVSITTPNEIDTSLYKDRLFLSGVGNKVDNVMVVKGEMNQYPNYFEGVQSVGVLQEDGSYKIEVSTNNGGFKNLFDINNFFVNSNDRGNIIVSEEDNSIIANHTDWYYTVETNIDLKAGKKYIIKLDFEGTATHTTKYSLIMLGDKGYNLNAYNHTDFEKVIEWAPYTDKELKASFNIEYTPSSDKTVYLGLSHGLRTSGSIKIKNIEIAEYNDNLNMDIPLKSHNVAITSNNPLAKRDKLYWNKSNKRYEIDRSGEIEIPTVEGNVMDLPRLYQKVDTNIRVETGNINPSEIEIEYIDIN